ncbi:hypothetical protein M422DRAFT_247144 [Sphaerobolus stellatus SS14]|nr:hypothetical protein M422DRAFT_247144 [Sphaerobolus stellatus SS14]
MVGDGDEADASGEAESEVGYADETLGRDSDVVKEQGLALENMELEMGGEGEKSGERSETESEKTTPKAMTMVLNTAEAEESEELDKTSDATLGNEEESDDKSNRAGDHLPTKGKKSGKQAVKK